MMTRTITALALLVPLTACNSGGDTESGAASNESGAPVAASPIGEWPGTITRGEAASESHTVEVLDHADGQLQLGLQEFCNIDLEGAAPSWSSAEGASCLVDLGDGRNPTNVSASVRLEGDTLLIIANFDGGVMWSFEGSR